MQIVEALSPNHDARADDTPIDILLLHYTGMPTGAAALERMRDQAAKVSAHYMVEEDGRVFRLVAEDRRAWHAGVACWAGAHDINGRSVGIELVNPGHEFGYRPFPEAQMQALIALAAEILARHPIPAHRVLAHSDVAPARKEDPGELFDWRRLAAAGIGLWPVAVQEPRLPPAVSWFQSALHRFGYCVPRNGKPDAATREVIAAFQRRFRPEFVTGRADTLTAARLDGLLRAVERSGANT